MKNTIAGIGIACLIMLILGGFAHTLYNLQADSPRQPHAAIVIGYQEQLIPVEQRTPETGPIAGIEVIWISASPGCPPVHKGEPLGIVIGRFLEAGFRLESMQGSGRCLMVR